MDYVTCRKGDTWQVGLTIKDSNDALVDFTNYTFEYGLKVNYFDTSYVIQPSQVTLTSSSAGRITGSITPTVTSSVNEGTYLEEIKVKNQTGTIIQRFQRKRIVEGRVITTN
jgi:hypothetical protein